MSVDDNKSFSEDQVQNQEKLHFLLTASTLLS